MSYISKSKAGRWIHPMAEEGLLELQGSRPYDCVDMRVIEDTIWPFLKELTPEERRRVKRLMESLQRARLEITYVSGAD